MMLGILKSLHTLKNLQQQDVRIHICPRKPQTLGGGLESGTTGNESDLS